jgi:hypothetical protein
MKYFTFGALILIGIGAFITTQTNLLNNEDRVRFAPEQNKEEVRQTKDSQMADTRLEAPEDINETKQETAFSNIGLQTNTAVHSIPLSEVLGGGPPKDGIPAINNPEFQPVSQVDWLDDENLGILYENQGEVRYYPYAILYWHEIVNDTVRGQDVAVTFCPLCGSAVVFDRGSDLFGVSGKLWESNLLMYDQKTESLWSQILGEAVVGDRTGESLEVLSSNIIRWEEVIENYPDAKVLSRETGFRRNYGRSPYGNYEDNNSLFFPVSNQDQAFHKKELFHIVSLDGKSIGFQRSELIEAKEASVEVNNKIIQAEAKDDGTIEVIDTSTNTPLPGYTAMWFSWVTHADKERVIWPKQ